MLNVFYSTYVAFERLRLVYVKSHISGSPVLLLWKSVIILQL